MQKPFGDVQLKVNEYFESSSRYWKEIYLDNSLLPTIYQERHNVTLGWIAEFHGSFAEHGPAGQEFQGGRVGRRFGLNKHRLLSSVRCGWPEKAPAPG